MLPLMLSTLYMSDNGLLLYSAAVNISRAICQFITSILLCLHMKLNVENHDNTCEYITEAVACGFRPPARLHELVETFGEQNTNAKTYLDMTNIVVNNRVCKGGKWCSPHNSASINNNDVNHGGVCVFCTAAFKGPWTTQSGCICQLCVAMSV